MANKITKKECLEKMLTLNEFKAHPELVEYANHELFLIQKKADSRKVASNAAKEETEKLKTLILEELSKFEEPVTIRELQTASEPLSLNHYTNQRLAAVMTKMLKEDKTLVNIKDKRLSKYSVA